MNRPEENKNEPLCEACLRIIGNIEFKQARSRDNCDTIEYVLPYNATRLIKIDAQKNYIIVYTFDSKIQPRLTEEFKENEIFFTAYVNERLVMTGLELNLEKNEYRYKSSQGFPKGVDVSGVVECFFSLHDAHFPKLRESIQEFHRSNDPNESSKNFHNSIKGN